MSEKAYNSSDIPAFDTYPSPPPVNRVDLVKDPERKGHSTLEQRAAELGAAAGKVVQMVRRVRSTAGSLPEHPAVTRIGALAEETKARAEQLRSVSAEFALRWGHQTGERVREIAQNARDRSRELGRQAKSGYTRARNETGRIAREYPLHVALGAGAVGFLLGVTLRIGRSRRAI